MSSSGLGRYREALNALAARTGAPVSSLAVSFALLHEITAIVPFAGIFVTSRWLGFGETIAFRVHNYEGGSPAWLYMKRLLDDGDRWAERVGRRYGIWGFPKGPRPAEAPEGAHVGTNLLGDVANAVVAYGITKAILPFRIGLSLYLTPGFSRGVIEPVRKGVLKLVWKRQ